MDLTIQPGALSGRIEAIPSKSQAHRLLICAAFADGKTELTCREINRDIEATADCLRSLGAGIQRSPKGYCVTPIQSIPTSASLNCCESGSTLRFMLPIVGALGVDATFFMEGRLPARPLSPLWEEMERMGCTLTRPTPDTLRCLGSLRPGSYSIDGSVSSQFITGLLFATSLLDADSTIHITGKLESKPYVDLTQQAMKLFGVGSENFHVKGGQVYRSPGKITVEGDWSNGSFWLAADALGSKLTVENLNPASAQGDRAAAELIDQLCAEKITISAADIPDLVPILSVVAAAKHGAVFTDIRRLRLKESDRVASTVATIEGLGGKAEATKETLTVYGTGLRGGTVDSVNDHRIAMSAAIASTVCTQSVTVLGAEAVNKSYPHFWDEFARLGGTYEQHIR